MFHLICIVFNYATLRILEQIKHVTRIDRKRSCLMTLISVLSSLSTIITVECLLNLSSPILDRRHVFRCHADENERSPTALVARFTASSLQFELPVIASFLVQETLTPPTGFRQNMISSPPLT